MSTFTGLTTMVRGIYMNQLSLNTVGHNIVNATNEGYSRQYAAPVATQAEHRPGLFANLEVGTGVDALSLTRSRDTFADFQFRRESTKQSYYETMATDYDTIEAIFNDAQGTGVSDALNAVFQAWSALSTEGPTAANRTTVIESSKILCDTIKTTASQLQDEINSKYEEIKNHTEHVDQMLATMVELNQEIVAAEADGSMANDLRDQRDMVADDLSKYFTLTITENDRGAYQVVGNGVMLLNGFDRLQLSYDEAGIATARYGVDYGVSDHFIKIENSNENYAPSNGILKAHYDGIDVCKEKMDTLADIADFLMTTFNDQHAAGYDMDGNIGGNFFGITDYTYEYAYDARNMHNVVYATDEYGNTTKMSGIQIINSLKVNSDFDAVGGYRKVAAASRYRDLDKNNEWITYTADTDMDAKDDDGNYIYKIDWGNRTGDGTNAVYLSMLFNTPFSEIVEGGRSNAAIIQKYTLKDANNMEVYDNKGAVTYVTALGRYSINSFYESAMTQIGVDAAAIDTSIDQHDIIMTQIKNWRDSVSGVDWNEELTDMIKYQKAYTSCARCLTAMDECLDRLVNNTGTVGR